VCHSVRDGERGQEDQRGGGVEEEEDVMSIILAGPYGEVRHALASTSALASCILSRLATVACMTINEYFKWKVAQSRAAVESMRATVPRLFRAKSKAASCLCLLSRIQAVVGCVSNADSHPRGRGVDRECRMSCLPMPRACALIVDDC
jgi:hypothetical protein